MFCFFFRRLNDLDQIAPLVFEYSKNNNHKDVFYICTNNDLDFESNKIAKFLLKNGVKMGYLHNFLLKQHEIIFLDIIFRLKKIFYKHLGSFFGKIINKCYQTLNNKNLYIKFLEKNQISTLIFDYPSDFNHIIKTFITLKKDLKFKIIGIEHGILSYKNFTDYKKKETQYENCEYKDFDKIIVPNELSKKKLIYLGYDLKKISVAGCPRFTSVWNFVLRKKIFTNLNISVSQKKIKIVFMDHSSKYGVIEDNYLNLIKFINQQNHIDFKIKPNTSNQNNSAVSSKNIPEELISNNDSINLIDWSDIVICINSSIIFDAILNDKIFYYPKYFHKQEMEWDNDPCCIQFKREIDLFDNIQNLNREILFKLKKSINKKNILERNVFLGKKDDENFLKNYINQNLN
tara:strand:+ start:4065 stop:5273 length:1209 start_codon:yes stop_codon:yes gene_type:complete